MADTSLLPGLDVAWMALGTLGAAAATALGAWAWARRGTASGRRVGWRWRVTAGDAWTAADSWLTNVTVVTGVLSSLWSRFTLNGGVLGPTTVDAPLFVLFLLFTAAAGLAPVIYAACGAEQPGDAVTGTVFGYLLAATAVLLGAFGMMAALALYVWDALAQVAQTRAVVLPFIGLGALLTLVYAVRTLAAVLGSHTAAPPSGPAAPPPPTPQTASYLVGPGRGRRSATL